MASRSMRAPKSVTTWRPSSMSGPRPRIAIFHDVATPDMIRQLPAGFALVIRGGCAPVIARLPRAWKNPAYRRARRLGHLPTEPTAESTPYPVFVPQQRGIPDHVPAEWTPGNGPSHPWD